MSEDPNITTALRLFRAIEQGVTDGLSEFYAADVVQQEFPNRLLPTGACRNLSEVIDGAKRGNQIMSSQKFDIHSSVASGDLVAIELTWTGVLAIPFGLSKKGDKLTAHIAIFMEFKGGKIVAQRNYDCFQRF